MHLLMFQKCFHHLGLSPLKSQAFGACSLFSSFRCLFFLSILLTISHGTFFCPLLLLLHAPSGPNSLAVYIFLFSCPRSVFIASSLFSYPRSLFILSILLTFYYGTYSALCSCLPHMGLVPLHILPGHFSCSRYFSFTLCWASAHCALYLAFSPVPGDCSTLGPHLWHHLPGFSSCFREFGHLGPPLPAWSTRLTNYEDKKI